MNEVLSTLASVIGALNTVEVRGKQNLAVLHGAISILEDLGNKLAQSSAPHKEGKIPVEDKEDNG